MQLTTSRLTLRSLCENDVMEVYALFSNHDVMSFLDLPHSDIEYTKKYVKNLLDAYQESPRRCYELAVLLKETQEFIGIVNLEVETLYIEDGRACLDYYFMPEHWNMGYATEASKVLIKFAFEVLNVNKIVSGTLKSNIGSEAVMKKCGMQIEAEFKQHTKWNGEWVNRVEYAILRKEYFSKRC